VDEIGDVEEREKAEERRRRSGGEAEERRRRGVKIGVMRIEVERKRKKAINRYRAKVAITCNPAPPLVIS
jgi:hypothetical protein